MHPEIFTAIRSLKLIQFDYRGHYRVVEPHMFGRRQGLDQVLGYQVRGTAAEGLNQDWRMFDVARNAQCVHADRDLPGAHACALGPAPRLG